MEVSVSQLPENVKKAIKGVKCRQIRNDCSLHQYASYTEVLIQGIDTEGRNFCKIFTYKGEKTI